MRHSALTTSSRRLTAVKAVSATSVLLAATLLIGSAPASAAPGDPVVSFIDAGGNPSIAAQLKSSGIDGSVKTSLTPDGLNVSFYAVSEDGNTVAVSGAAGSYTAESTDVTYGTIVVRRTGSAEITRLISSQYRANPVVSQDGLTVWFLNGIYSSATNKSTLALYKYDVATQTTTRLNLASDFQPAAATGAGTLKLAISPDGSKAAIVYQSFDAQGNSANPSRIFAADITAGKTGNYFEQKQISGSNTLIGYQSLAWGDDNSTLTFNQSDTATGHLSNYSVAVTSANSAAVAGPLADWYDATRYGNEWWMWKDDLTAHTTTFGHSSDVSPVVAPSTTGIWGGDFYVGSFRLSTNTPPVVGTPQNLPAARPQLSFYATSVGFNRKTQYVSYNDYMVPIAGQTCGIPTAAHPNLADNCSESQRGTLESSTDGKTYKTVLVTTGAHPVSAGGWSFWSGNTPAVTRNVYYRWRFTADIFCAGGVSPATKITMIPTVTTTIKKVGAKRAISGTATRVGGSVILYKVVGPKATKIVTKPVSAKGAYNFGTLSLKTGSYRVSTVADGYAGVGSKTFKV